MLIRRAVIIALLAATALPSPGLAAADCGLIRDRDLRRACSPNKIGVPPSAISSAMAMHGACVASGLSGAERQID